MHSRDNGDWGVVTVSYKNSESNESTTMIPQATSQVVQLKVGVPSIENVKNKKVVIVLRVFHLAIGLP
jgi:hypothetical protein